MLNVGISGWWLLYIYDFPVLEVLIPDKGICIRRRSLDGKIDEIIYEYEQKLYRSS